MKIKFFRLAIFLLIAQNCEASVRILNEEAEFDRIAKEYESIIASKMLKQMHAGVKPNPVTGGGASEAMFMDLMLEEYGKEVARKGDIGLAKAIKKDMLRREGR